MLRFQIFLVVLILQFANFAQAKEIPVQARFFVGITSTDPKNVNDAIVADGLKKFDNVTQVGFEATYPIVQYLNVGVRYTKRLAESDPSSGGTTGYNAKIDQDAVLLLARGTFLKTDIVRLDAFAGFGGTNTSLKIKTATQDGELTRRASGDWFANPYTAFGGSLSIGYKQFYLVFEGGLESNKVDGFKTTGHVNSSINTLDLSGGYFTVGLMFDGLSGTIGK
ncbi:MAG TPA: hypothetical protein VN132_15780 [Bdellovibrio sp.]|nr:hypothetical protein [Bdellovibrio sp.]